MASVCTAVRVRDFVHVSACRSGRSGLRKAPPIAVVAAGVVAALLLDASNALSQTTYHLHNDASSTAGLSQLKTAGPDQAAVALQTANLRSTANGEKLVKAFDTQAGVPGVVGAIPSGATLTFRMWMRKTANVGTMFPRARVRLNNSTGTTLCTATGTTAVTTTLTLYTISCTTTANIALTAATRLYVWAGVNMTGGSTTTNFNAELDIEGTLNGNYNSRVDMPAILPPPTLVAPLSPTSGGVGQLVTVSGTNFGATQGTSTIRFNTTTATPTTWSATSITAPVPSGATTGNATVTVAGQVSNGLAFTVLPTPTISSLSPTSGAPGVAVTINGSNFGASQGTSTVTFNGTPITTITSWIATRIVTVVPAGASTGPVRVTVNGVASAGTTFTVPVPPSISGVTPPAASAPSSVVIAGSGFGATQGASTVRFNGTTATVSAWSSTSITATVPNGATSGPLVVTVGGVASNSFSYTVPPSITSVSPDPVVVGVTMTISGTNFGATQGSSTVSFDGNVWPASQWSSTQIRAAVGTNGPLVVTVNGVASAPRAFTVVPPPSLNPPIPAQAAIGSVITLTGQNFGVTQGPSTLTVNGATATPTQWTDTEITTPVPAGATATGNVTVTVGGVAASQPFTVAPAPQVTSLAPASGLPGTPVVINGVNFGSGASYSNGGNTVTFGGVVATVTSWTDTSVSVVVPVGARSGPVVVTVGVDASNGAAFVVPYGPTIQSVTPNAGPVGATIVISGSELGTNGIVTFNGVTAATAAWSSTSVTATVPSGASTGPVLVNVGGTPTNALPFTVTGTAGSVTGTVTAAAGGAAVPGATIQAWQSGVLKGTGTSNASGVYAVAVTTGTYDIRVDAAGFGTHVQTAHVVSGPGGPPLNVALSVAGSITGTVTETDGTTPIPDAAVIVQRGDVSLAMVLTSATGTYSVSGLGASSYRVEVMATAYVPRSQPATVTAGQSTTANVALSGQGLAPIQYVYDDVGRLKAIIDRGGDAATFTYDTAGNILAIERQSSGNVSVIGVSPASGAIGATVQITGTGFATVPAQNTVSIGSTPTTVTAATATSLTITVPAGATTATVSVTSPSGSATSAGVFTVLASSGLPTIASISPATGPALTSVVITGSNFGTALDTKVKFNGTAAYGLSSVTPTSLTVPAPNGATSGRVTVTTASGTALSSQDYFFAFPGEAGFTGRVAVGGFIDVPLNSTQVSLVVFDGTVGQRVMVGATFTGTTGACSMTLQGPGAFSQTLGNSFCPTVQAAPTVVTLPTTATYTLRALLGGTGTARVTLYDVPPDLTGTLTAGGAPVAMATVPGQKATYTFTGAIGSDLALTFANNSYATCWMYVNTPSNTNLVSRACSAGSHVNLPPLQSDQAYSLVVQPWNASSGGVTIALLAPVPGTLTIDDVPLTLTTTVPGQSAQFSFSGLSGQRVGAEATSDTFSQCQQFALVAPDGTIQAIPPAGCAGGLFLGAETLGATGTYWIVREPNALATGTTTMRVVTVPADVSDTTTVGGLARTLTTTAAGQNATLSFAGAATQTVTIQATGSTLGTAQVTLRRPDGSQAGQWFLTGASGGFAAGTSAMTQTGTYVLTIDPQGGSIGSVTLAIVTP